MNKSIVRVIIIFSSLIVNSSEYPGIYRASWPEIMDTYLIKSDGISRISKERVFVPKLCKEITAYTAVLLNSVPERSEGAYGLSGTQKRFLVCIISRIQARPLCCNIDSVVVEDRFYPDKKYSFADAIDNIGLDDTLEIRTPLAIVHGIDSKKKAFYYLKTLFELEHIEAEVVDTTQGLPALPTEKDIEENKCVGCDLDDMIAFAHIRRLELRNMEREAKRNLTRISRGRGKYPVCIPIHEV